MILCAIDAHYADCYIVDMKEFAQDLLDAYEQFRHRVLDYYLPKRISDIFKDVRPEIMFGVTPAGNNVILYELDSSKNTRPEDPYSYKITFQFTDGTEDASAVEISKKACDSQVAFRHCQCDESKIATAFTEVEAELDSIILKYSKIVELRDLLEQTIMEACGQGLPVVFEDGDDPAYYPTVMAKGFRLNIQGNSIRFTGLTSCHGGWHSLNYTICYMEEDGAVAFDAPLTIGGAPLWQIYLEYRNNVEKPN